MIATAQHSPAFGDPIPIVSGARDAVCVGSAPPAEGAFTLRMNLSRYDTFGTELSMKTNTRPPNPEQRLAKEMPCV